MWYWICCSLLLGCSTSHLFSADCVCFHLELISETDPLHILQVSCSFFFVIVVKRKNQIILKKVFSCLYLLQGGGGKPPRQDPGRPWASTAGGKREAAKVTGGVAGRDPDREKQGSGGPEKEGRRPKTIATCSHAQGRRRQWRRAPRAGCQSEARQDSRGKMTGWLCTDSECCWWMACSWVHFGTNAGNVCHFSTTQFQLD